MTPKITVFLIGLMIALCGFSTSAEPTKVDIPVMRRQGGAASGSFERAPMHLPIDVTFDDATGILRVSAPEDLEGSVYVYSVSGALEGYSETLNATFTLTTPGLHVISLQGENWIGEGKIIL